MRKNIAILLIAAMVIMGLATGCPPEPNPEDNPKVEYWTVSFDTDGGTPTTIDSIQVEKGLVMGSQYPSPPTKDGYAFSGWYLTSDTGFTGTRYLASTPITANTALKAKWTSNLCTVSFDTNGGTPDTIASIQVTKTQSMGSQYPANPTQTGFTFGGWYLASDSGFTGTQYISTTPITADTALKAKWNAEIVPEYWTVTFNTDGGTPATINSIQVIRGQVIGGQFPSDPTKTGNTFGGWYLASDTGFSGTRYLATTPITADTALKAKWTAVVEYWTVSFDTDGGTPATINSIQVIRGQSMGSQYPTNPTKSGYSFGGWYLASDTGFSGTQYTSATNITADTALKAKWSTTVEYWTVSFNTDGGSPSSITSLQVIRGQSMGSQYPSNPSKTYYSFDGWYLTSDTGFTGTQYTSTVSITANTSLIAKWTYVGGTPIIQGNTIYHDRPLFEVNNGSTSLNSDGTYNLTGNAAGIWIQYKFPTNVNGQNANTYDYIVVQLDPGGATGNATAVQYRQYGSTAVITGGGSNKSPWLENAGGNKAVLEIGGTGTSGGFRIAGNNGNTAMSNLGINSITFYKAPRYTVTFDANYPGAPAIPAVTNIWGQDDNHEGYGVGEANWPAAPSRSSEVPPMYFVAWKNSSGTVYTPNTKITGNTVLTAEWTATAPDTRYIEKITTSAGGVGAALYAFELPAGAKIGDYTQITFKTRADTAISNQRCRAWGPLNQGDQNTWATLPVLTGNVLAMDNANPSAGDLLVTGGIGANNGFSQTVSASWTSRTQNFDSTKPRNWNGGNTTGVILIAIGVIGGPGADFVGSYYIKDVALAKANGADPVPATDPRSAIWRTSTTDATLIAKPGAQTQASGASITVTREFLPYQE